MKQPGLDPKLLALALKELNREGDPVLAIEEKGDHYLIYFSSPTEPIEWRPKRSQRRSAKGTSPPKA